MVVAQLHFLSQPRQLRRLKIGVCLLAVVWLAWVLAGFFWLLVPQAAPSPSASKILNPAIVGAGAGAIVVNLDEMVSWNLFGALDSTAVAKAPEPEAPVAAEGIEDGAKETTLNLKLQGLVASSVQEEARAVIEYQNKQVQYAVGDKLPVSGSVKLAKVLNDRVVLNNGGRYELLMLFDESSLAGAAPMEPAPAPEPEGDEQRIDQRGKKDVTAMAESYRDRLYTDPTSLAEAVRISAKRVDGRLQGYLISPGRDKEQFERLGFQANDVVVGVNGIALTDPGKAMELYRVMRAADEASFSVMRGDEEITLVVGLEKGADSQ